MKNTDQLSIVHAAYILGADTPAKVEKATGVPKRSAANCLVWIRKADGDLAEALRLRRRYNANDQRHRYSTDSDWRHRRMASSTAYQRRQSFCRNGYRVPFSGREATMQ